jgi:peroxiredoxin
MTDMKGKTAKPFSIRDSNGNLHSHEAYKGSWLLMVFHRHLG